MKPLSAAEIRGNWATLLLPIQADDTIDFTLLAEEIDRFAAARVNGVYSNGSAGEFYTQTEAEFDRLHALLAEKCERHALPFQIGLSQPSAQLARERLRRTRALRPAAFQVTLPGWFPPTLPESLDFLATMAAEAAPIPLIVYNPPHAKRRLTPAEWLAVAEHVPGVVGIKVPGGDEAWYAAMQPVLARWSVFIPGHLLAEGIARGAHGAYSNVACLSPAGAQRWYDGCARDLAAGRELGRRCGRGLRCVVLVEALGLGLEDAGRAAERARQLRELRRAEQEQDDGEDDEDLGGAEAGHGASLRQCSRW